jgi:hypothetical protein
MTEVWIVYGFTPYEGEETLGVFSTKEKAAAAVPKLRSNKDWETYDYYREVVDSYEAKDER